MFRSVREEQGVRQSVLTCCVCCSSTQMHSTQVIPQPCRGEHLFCVVGFFSFKKHRNKDNPFRSCLFSRGDCLATAGILPTHQHAASSSVVPLFALCPAEREVATSKRCALWWLHVNKMHRACFMFHPAHFVCVDRYLLMLHVKRGKSPRMHGVYRETRVVEARIWVG